MYMAWTATRGMHFSTPTYCKAFEGSERCVRVSDILCIYFILFPVYFLNEKELDSPILELTAMHGRLNFVAASVGGFAERTNKQQNVPPVRQMRQLWYVSRTGPLISSCKSKAEKAYTTRALSLSLSLSLCASVFVCLCLVNLTCPRNSLAAAYLICATLQTMAR